MKIGGISIISIMFLISVFLLSSYSHAASSSIEAVCEKYAHVGEKFEVRIEINSSTPSKGAQCDIVFNPDVIHALNVSNGGMFDMWMDDLSPNFTKIDNVN
ncbi:MAG: hypothetical protein J7K61_05400, partial [Thermoplasmata archaeon]|nr:hypothetical protein [Thermoplasmata archaeon]